MPFLSWGISFINMVEKWKTIYQVNIATYTLIHLINQGNEQVKTVASTLLTPCSVKSLFEEFEM